MFLTIELCTKLFEIELIIFIKMDLALNNLQMLMCHKTQTTNQPEPLITQSFMLVVVVNHMTLLDVNMKFNYMLFRK